MKYQVLFAALAGLAASSPVEKRQLIGGGGLLGGGGDNDLREGECKKVTFIFARGSTEPGLMGMTVGPATCEGLLEEFPDQVACQGVGPEYEASIGTNMLPSGTSDEAAAEAQSLFEMAHEKCPETAIVGGGYSQGAAVMHASIPNLSPEVKEQIKGVVLFGDTRNEQDDGQIPDFPADKALVICAPGDMVCSGTLMITAAHLSYNDDVPEAVEFLAGNIGSGGSSGSDSGSEDGGIFGGIGGDGGGLFGSG